MTEDFTKGKISGTLEQEKDTDKNYPVPEPKKFNKVEGKATKKGLFGGR